MHHNYFFTFWFGGGFGSALDNNFISIGRADCFAWKQNLKKTSLKIFKKKYQKNY
jgi:hypothetical protein